MDEATAVVGLGSTLRGDDGVGPQVVASLARRLDVARRGGALPVPPPDLLTGGLPLLEIFAAYRRVLLVDAMHSGRWPPGTIKVFSPRQLVESFPPGPLVIGSGHGGSPAAAMVQAERLGLPVPQYLRVWGVEAAETAGFSEALSPPVAAAVPQVVTALLAELGV
ncbi:hydrogenase maturation protease [Desulfurivibrio alkaliphilus]|uniref:hydrogenase maturation protease n=1 Tax=Desulfurivibrio alkaliphilus TaxID=427923 RepID=UPI00032245D4|nr:hydrogenase maturation protease [Desulfurivibrio alkaliphilus]